MRGQDEDTRPFRAARRGCLVGGVGNVVGGVTNGVATVAGGVVGGVTGAADDVVTGSVGGSYANGRPTF